MTTSSTFSASSRTRTPTLAPREPAICVDSQDMTPGRHLYKVIAVLTLIATTELGFAAPSEMQSILSSSHVGLIGNLTIKSVENGEAIVEAVIKEQIKGRWLTPKAIFYIRLPRDGKELVTDGKYIVFCSEQVSRVRGLIYDGTFYESILVPEAEVKTVVSRLERLAAEEQTVVEKALQEAALRPTDEYMETVNQIVALLFKRETQKEAVRKLLALPSAANKMLMMFLYDTRRIPAGILSPDEVIKSSRSKHEQCDCIQDVIIWMLSERLGQRYGYIIDGTSFAARSAIADAWIYRFFKEYAGSP